MVPLRACSEALRLSSAAALARRVSLAEGDEVLLKVLPTIACRWKPLWELTERSCCCLGVVLVLWSAIWLAGCYCTHAGWLQGQSHTQSDTNGGLPTADGAGVRELCCTSRVSLDSFARR